MWMVRTCRLEDAMVGFILWLLLLVFCWPLVWLLVLPLRLAGIAVEGVLALVRALVFLPARVLGGRR
jgi:hypothetical protein